MNTPKLLILVSLIATIATTAYSQNYVLASSGTAVTDADGATWQITQGEQILPGDTITTGTDKSLAVALWASPGPARKVTGPNINRWSTLIYGNSIHILQACEFARIRIDRLDRAATALTLAKGSLVLSTPRNSATPTTVKVGEATIQVGSNTVVRITCGNSAPYFRARVIVVRGSVQITNPSQSVKATTYQILDLATLKLITPLTAGDPNWWRQFTAISSAQSNLEDTAILQGYTALPFRAPRR